MARPNLDILSQVAACAHDIETSKENTKIPSTTHPNQSTSKGTMIPSSCRVPATSRSSSGIGSGPTRANTENNKKRKTPPHRWSEGEDAKLREAVRVFGSKKWKSIAQRIPHRSHIQCLQRWTKVLAPGLVKGHWKFEEDEKLRAIVGMGTNKNWGGVSSQMEGRTYVYGYMNM